MSLTELTEKMATSGAATETYRGAQTIAVYSDTAEEFAALRSAAGIYDLGWRAKIVLTGSDRVRWLNGMVTNNVRDLPINRGVYAFLLNPQGRIQADLYAYHRGEHLLVDTDQSQLETLLGIFDHYIIMDDVEVSNASEKLTAIGVAGPKASAVLEAAGLDVGNLEPLEAHDAQWRELGVTVVRSDNEAVDAYELWLASSRVNELWEGLVNAGATPVGSRAYELFRIAAGIPRYGQDIKERDLPQETEQKRAVHFNKGCYVGQEIVERIHSRGNVHRMFTGLELEGAKPEPGAKVMSASKEVGEVTSSAVLPTAEKKRTLALGYVRREHVTAGKDLVIGEATATISKVPFSRIFSE
jgi:folate-binding protein YgfZ